MLEKRYFANNTRLERMYAAIAKLTVTSRIETEKLRSVEYSFKRNVWCKDFNVYIYFDHQSSIMRMDLEFNIAFTNFNVYYFSFLQAHTHLF